MPKKPARNAFWYFMAEWKANEERNGRIFPNGFRDVQASPECNEAWQALSPEQKAPFTDKAKKGKMQPDNSKQTSIGESVSVIKAEEQREFDFMLNMEAHIRDTVAAAKKYDILPTLRFPFIHMNYYYMRKPDSGPVDYCPAEFAIGEFSIQNGLSRHYHEIIKTTPHLGYTREAMEVSEKTHRLHWNLPIGEGDWAIIYYKMKEFLEPLKTNDELPPIYASKKVVHLLPSLFRRMAEAVGQTPDMFVVYSLESLYGHILRAVSDHPESKVVAILAETQLEKELFAYTPNIECDHHKTEDGTSQFCSLSVIRQWAFEFCDQCCKPLGVKMITGIHCPDKVQQKPRFNAHNYSFSSASEASVAVLSATGVSQQHRIAVSERSRDEKARRRGDDGRIEIIDHSLKKSPERPKSPQPAPVVAPIPPQFSRMPKTISQALMGGVSRPPPVFNGENFPAIGGRGFPRQSQTRRPEGPIWSHRGQDKNSDSD